jgi:hypothetical protein
MSAIFCPGVIVELVKVKAMLSAVLDVPFSHPVLSRERNTKLTFLNDLKDTLCFLFACLSTIFNGRTCYNQAPKCLLQQ